MKLEQRTIRFYVPQPAYKIYAFGRGWRIMRYVTSHLFQRTHGNALGWFHAAGNLAMSAHYKGWFLKCVFYIAVAGLLLGGAAQYLSAMLVVALFLIIYATLLSIWIVISTLLMGILATCNFAYSRYYGIFFRCPDCHKEMPLPVFLCGICHTEHTRLWPSIYGVLFHRCKNCNTKLPTLGLLGRKELARICPHCRRPLNKGVGSGTNLHIPLVGAASTGKTNYIMTATREFKHLYESLYGYSIKFTDSTHQQIFEANTQRLTTGRVLMKTPDIVPHAYTLSIKPPRVRVPTLAYIYDPAGEAFHISEHADSQVFFKYIDGIIFVIDPCAIPHYRKEHYEDIEALREFLRPSDADIMQSYERMKQMFEASVGIAKGRRYSHPVAVVVTKVDAFDLESEIGAPAAHTLMEIYPSVATEEDAISTVVRDFLYGNGLDDFVRELELHFSNVKYFSCSALGRLPTQDDTSSFTPIRVTEPLIWLLTQTKAVKHVHKANPPLLSQAKETKQTIPLEIEQTLYPTSPDGIEQILPLALEDEVEQTLYPTSADEEDWAWEE